MKNKNARHSLGAKEGVRSLCTGEFVRTGIKHGYMGDVVNEKHVNGILKRVDKLVNNALRDEQNDNVW